MLTRVPRLQRGHFAPYQDDLLPVLLHGHLAANEMVRANCVYTTGHLVSIANEKTASQFPLILQSLYQNCLSTTGPETVSCRAVIPPTWR